MTRRAFSVYRSNITSSLYSKPLIIVQRSSERHWPEQQRMTRSNSSTCMRIQFLHLDFEEQATHAKKRKRTLERRAEGRQGHTDFTQRSSKKYSLFFCYTL